MHDGDRGKKRTYAGWQFGKVGLEMMVFECKKCFFLLMACLGVVSFILNSSIFAIMIYYRRRLLKSNDYKLLCSMIVADMLVGIFGILYGVLLYNEEETIIYKTFAVIPMFSTMFASIASIAGMTVNRMVAVHMPLKYHTIMTSKKLFILFIVIWLIPIAVYTIQLCVYKTNNWRFELQVRSIQTVGFFILGSIALGIPNCLMYIAIRRQLRLIRAQAMLKIKLQQFPDISRNQVYDCDSQSQQRDSVEVKDDMTDSPRVIDNMGFQNMGNDTYSEMLETNETETKHENRVVKINGRKRDTSSLHGDRRAVKSVLQCRDKVNMSKESVVCSTKSTWSVTIGRLGLSDSKANGVISRANSPDNSNNCGSTNAGCCDVNNQPIAVICQDDGQEIPRTDDRTNMGLPDKSTERMNWNPRAKSSNKTRILLAKNATRALGRLQLGWKKKAKARKENLRMAHMCILVVLAFIVCWLPLSVYRLRYVIGMEPIVWFRRFALFLAASNSLVNPFIYLLKQKTLRRHIQLIFCGRKAASNQRWYMESVRYHHYTPFACSK